MNRYAETSVILSDELGRGAPLCGRAPLFRFLLFFAILNSLWVVPAKAARSGGGKTTVPAAPSNLGATAVSSSQINLNWQDNSSNESGFKILRGTTVNGTWSQVSTASAGANSYQ